MGRPRLGRNDDIEEGAAPGAPAEAVSGRFGEILNVAALIFRERGYEGASTEEIGKAVGLLKGSLYYYIDSKEDLLFHVLWGVHGRVAIGVEEACASVGDDPMARLRIFLERHFLLTAENLVAAGVFYHDFRSLNEERRNLIIGLRDSYESFLRGLLSEGQEAGVVCPDLDLKLVSAGMLSVLNSIHLWYHPDVGRPPAEMAEILADLLLGGLYCSPVTHRAGHRTQLGVLSGGAEDGVLDVRDASSPTVLDLTSGETEELS